MFSFLLTNSSQAKSSHTMSQPDVSAQAFRKLLDSMRRVVCCVQKKDIKSRRDMQAQILAQYGSNAVGYIKCGVG